MINTDKGKYRFEYNLDKYTLPDPLTVSTDHWGFWNGDNKNAASYKSKDFCDNINDYRKVNSMGTSLAGLLYKVVYPAGGYTEITYEPNYYTGFWQRDNSKLAYNYVQTEKQLCGGARVASIKDYDHVSKQSITRIIKYKSPENTAESGIIGFTPKYNVNATEKFSQRGTKGYWVDVIEIVDGKEVVRREYKTDLYMDVITTYTTTMNSVSFNTNSTFREYFIGYSDVTEYYNDGSYVHYTYSSRKDVLDNNQDYTHRVYLPSNLISSYEGSSLSECEQAEAFNLYELNDMSRFRGILQSETTYSALGVVISKATHTYNLEDAKTQYTTCVRSVPRGMAAYKIYLQPCLLTSREKVEYATNGQIKTEYSYKYNKYNQLSEIKKTNSDGSNYFVAYQYVTDIIKRTNAETELFKRNILNSLLSVVKRKDSTITDALTFQYSTSLNDTRMPLLYCILSKGIPGEKYTLETYHKYDCYGNPIYTTTKDNISSVILWSYKGLYPIVEIKNTSYEEVCNALGVTPESLLTTDKPDINRLNAIRAKLPNALITTYEHIPHVGIKTINKSGIIDYFEYDSAGRLMNVLDEKKHLVNTYNYHYTTE